VRHQTLTATALVTRNSLSYIESVFALNAARQPLVNVPDEAFAKALTGIAIDRCITPDTGSGWFTARHDLIHDDLPAQITYTSGTEGKPKGIVLTYANLADAAERIIDQMALTDAVREYVGVPVTYSFGMGRIRAVSAAGGQSYLPAHGFDPAEIARMLRAGEINALSAVPTLLRIVLQKPAVIGDAGKNLRWLEIGSQFMTGAEKRAIRDLFPNARIVQHYGLTEASRSTFLRISEADDSLLDSVGKPVGKTEVGISDDGRIRIRGPHVAEWRIDAEELQALRDPDGWLQTSDLGHMRDGHLYFDGRADDLINSGGIKINPDMLEARIGAILGQTGQVVVTKVPDALRGEGVLVATEVADLDAQRLRNASAQALKELGVSSGDALHVEVLPVLPRTATGKPQRRQLTQDFVERKNAADAFAPQAKNDKSSSQDVHAFFREFFPGRDIGTNDSFETMGGDSLSYIQFSLGFEDRFGLLPSGWESQTVAQLEALRTTQAAQNPAAAGGRKPWRRLEAATLTRAFFMICIVALHLDTFVYSSNWGAAYFLFLLCGYSVMRFQWPEISRTGNVTPIFWTVLRVAIPTVLVIITMQVLARTFEFKPLTLVSNWFDPSEYHIAYYYFAEIYMQLLLIIAALLAIPKMRDWLRSSPLLVCTAIIIVSIGISALSERVWDTSFIYHRTPIWYMWTVGCGMMIATARDTKSRALTMAIVSLAILGHFGMTSGGAYLLGATALLLFWSEFQVPAVVKTIVAEIAASSMFIYLSHFQIKSLVIRVFHGPVPWLALIGAICFAIVTSHIYSWMEGRAVAFIRARGWWKQDRPTAALGQEQAGL